MLYERAMEAKIVEKQEKMNEEKLKKSIDFDQNITNIFKEIVSSFEGKNSLYFKEEGFFFVRTATDQSYDCSRIVFFNGEGIGRIWIDHSKVVPEITWGINHPDTKTMERGTGANSLISILAEYCL